MNDKPNPTNEETGLLSGKNTSQWRAPTRKEAAAYFVATSASLTCIAAFTYLFVYLSPNDGSCEADNLCYDPGNTSSLGPCSNITDAINAGLTVCSANLKDCFDYCQEATDAIQEKCGPCYSSFTTY